MSEGTGAREGRRFCESCGQGIQETTNFCPNCGAAQAPNPNVPTGPPPQNAQPGSITTPNVGVPPPPQDQQGAAPRRTGRNVLMGCLGLAVILVLILVLAGLCAGGGDNASNQSPPADEPAQEEGGAQQEAQQEPQPRPEPEPEPEPAPEPAPAPIELSGAGSAATEPFRLETGLTVIEMTHQGSANFIVDLLDESGASVAPMGVANVIGPIEGSQTVQIAEPGQHVLNVQADGPWSFTIRQPRPAERPATRSFSGNTKTATELFQLSAGLHTVQLTHQGDGNFIVDLLDENGASAVMMGVVNEIGPFDGSQAITVNEDGIYLFQVEANGPWTIEVE